MPVLPLASPTGAGLDDEPLLPELEELLPELPDELLLPEFVEELLPDVSPS